MIRQFIDRIRPGDDTVMLFPIALVKFLLPLLANSEFGFHRDEFLYIAMGRRLDWGYLEVSPLIGGVAWFANLLFGDSLFAYRFFPALTGALMVVLIWKMVRLLDGGRFAAILATLAFMFSPAFLRSNMLFQPVTFDQFFWTLAAYLLIRILKEEEFRLWLVLGVVIGVGILAKYTMLLFCVGLLVGLAATGSRRILLTKWPWLATGIALLMALPNILWQTNHGWPLITHMADLSKSHLAHVEPLGFMLMQLLMTLWAFPVWLAGLYFFLWAENGWQFRAIGWIYLVVLLALLSLSGKAYYLLPAYPMLFAAGGCQFEKLLTSPKRAWLRYAIPIWIIINNSPTIPYGVPILPIETFKKYAAFMADNLGLVEPLRWERGELHDIPQDYADMFGWEEQAENVAEVYHQLDQEEQQTCVILAGNYGQAGALEYYSEKYGLPQVVSLHGSYYLWGPGEKPAQTLLTVGIPKHRIASNCAEVMIAATITHEVARENDVPVSICRMPHRSLQEIWPQLADHRF